MKRQYVSIDTNREMKKLPGPSKVKFLLEHLKMLWFRTMLSHVKRTLCVSVSILGVYLIKQDAFNLKVNILSPKDLYKFEKKRIKKTLSFTLSL